MCLLSHSGGIGRRAAFRSLYRQLCASSNLVCGILECFNTGVYRVCVQNMCKMVYLAFGLIKSFCFFCTS